MSSMAISSTNDVTSTAASSIASGSFATDNPRDLAHTLTTDAIIRECIRQGFYRTPICNEKLYLHNHGFDCIAATAFEPYTDVKVLWLEGNGLSLIPCGEGYTQVQPPIRHDPFVEMCTEQHDVSQHVDPVNPSPPALPLAADVPVVQRDAFSSLYPTVRQLYLHNNIFREMPDLSRFQRLDAVNLSGNFFSRVESHCPYWATSNPAASNTEAPGGKEEPEDSAASPEDSDNTAAANLKPDGASTTTDATLAPPPCAELAICSPATAAAQREAALEQYRHLADQHVNLCQHCALPEPEEPSNAADAQHPFAPRPVPRQPPVPPVEYRNLCSSLRTLNLAGNRLGSFEDCLELLAFKAVTVLDLSNNNITDGEALLLLLERLPRLQSLKLSGNPLVRTMPRYRKRVLSRCKRLLHLDDRPVFDEERRLATAWTCGGVDGEEKERQVIQAEKAAAEKKRLDDFRRLISRHQQQVVGPQGEGSHADYIHAITTTGALSAAADTAGPRRSRHSADPVRRRASSDPDSSPTSSDSEEDSDVDTRPQQEVTLLPRHMVGGMERRPDMANENTAVEGFNMIVAGHENKLPVSTRPSPVGDGSGVPSQRVLSSNQRVDGSSVESGAAMNEGEEEEDDIFVPGA